MLLKLKIYTNFAYIFHIEFEDDPGKALLKETEKHQVFAALKSEKYIILPSLYITMKGSIDIFLRDNVLLSRPSYKVLDTSKPILYGSLYKIFSRFGICPSVVSLRLILFPMI